MSKNKHLSDYIYSSATLYCIVCSMSLKTEEFINLDKIKDNHKIIFLFSLKAIGFFGTKLNIYGETSCEKSSEICHYFCKKAPYTFGWVLNMDLGNTVNKKKQK